VSEDTPEAIGPYRIEGVLGQGGMGVVYRAAHADTGEPVALKTVLLPQTEMLHRIRREIHALARIRHPGVVRIVDQGMDEGLPWYAMELLEGTSLRQHTSLPQADAERSEGPVWWTRSLEMGESTRPLARPPRGIDPDAPTRPAEERPGHRVTLTDDQLHRTMTAVRRLCAPLAFLHGEGIVHRDLKPDNVLVRADETPVLVDFGLIAEFGARHNRESVTADAVAAGTPHYMAPEQATGSFVDARADLYSLGCVLFELLTGRPPFLGDSTMDVIRAHLSRPPCRPSEIADNIPQELDDLVLRLMEKRPEKRLGYAADVGSALARLGADNGAKGPQPRVYLYRPRFAGRDQATEQLQHHVARLPDGHGGLVLVGGESGVGKTRLVLEIARSAIEQGFQVMVGESRDGVARPLEPLRAPLQAIADRCKVAGREEVERLVGPRGPLLARYEAGFSDLPGQDAYPDPADLPPDAARERLFAAMAETFAAATIRQPMLLIIDDLQWADDLTLGLLRSWLKGDWLDRRALLVIGTYRTEEVSEGLERLLRAEGGHALALDRLDAQGVGSIVGDMLAIASPPEGLVGSVARQSEGNPFFVGEYLRTAVQEDLIFRDPRGRWRVAQPRDGKGPDEPFTALPLPGSLRDLVTRRLAALSSTARQLLEVAAVVGREGPMALTQAVSGLDDDQLDDACAELLQRHVLEEPRPGVLRFLHDKLREATYGSLGPEQLRARHQLVAEILDGQPRQDAEYVYTLAHHYARGETSQNPERVYQACAKAAARAMDDNAPGEAYEFFEQAGAIAAAAGLDHTPEFEAARGEACAQIGRLVEAAQHLGDALKRTDDPVRRSRLRARLATVRIATYDSARAWTECDLALRDLGRPFPKSRGWQLLTTAWDWMRGFVAGRLPRLFGSAQGQRRERARALADGYQTAMVVSYFEMDLLNFFQLSIRALLPANLIGPSRELVDAYSKYAVGMGAMKLIGVGDHYAAQAERVAETLGDVRLLSTAKLWRAITVSFSGRSAEGARRVQEILDQHGRWVDTADYINACADLTWNYVIRGYAREAWRVQEMLIRKTRETAGREGSMEGHPALSQRLVVLPMLGRADEGLPYIERSRKLAEAYPQDRFRTSFLNCNLVMFHLEQGQLGDEVERAIAEYRRVSPAPALTLYHLRWFYVFQAYARLAQCGEPPADAASLEALRAAIKELRQASLVDVLKGHLAVLKGAHARLRGQHKKADILLLKARHVAGLCDSPWVEYEATLHRALAMRDRGGEVTAREEAHRARRIAEEHGWTPRVSRIDTLFPS